MHPLSVCCWAAAACWCLLVLLLVLAGGAAARLACFHQLQSRVCQPNPSAFCIPSSGVPFFAVAGDETALPASSHSLAIRSTSACRLTHRARRLRRRFRPSRLYPPARRPHRKYRLAPLDSAFRAFSICVNSIQASSARRLTGCAASS